MAQKKELANDLAQLNVFMGKLEERSKDSNKYIYVHCYTMEELQRKYENLIFEYYSTAKNIENEEIRSIVERYNDFYKEKKEFVERQCQYWADELGVDYVYAEKSKMDVTINDNTVGFVAHIISDNNGFRLSVDCSSLENGFESAKLFSSILAHIYERQEGIKDFMANIETRLNETKKALDEIRGEVVALGRKDIKIVMKNKK